MNEIKRQVRNVSDVAVDFIPKGDYISPEIATREDKLLWQRVWQVACREEDIPLPGNYETYNIVDQSIIVLRTVGGEIRAFHNVCPHRGRELTSGCGSMTKIHCAFHGWQWDLYGNNTRVTDPEDWQASAGMDAESLKLKSLKVASWGGFVFVNMDPDCEPFEQFIQPVPQFLDCLELNTWRYSWRKIFTMKANWKIAIEAFMESYHVNTTHPQAIPIIDPANFSSAHGKHGRHKYYWERPLGAPAAATGLPMPADWRKAIAASGDFSVAELADVNGGKLDGQLTARSANALKRHLTETPDGLSQPEIEMLSLKYMAEAAIAEGAGWPALTLEQFDGLGADWNIFPNIVFVHSLDATLFFWARPNGRDPESCIFQMASLARNAPGQKPKPEREYLIDIHAEIEKIPHLLAQDLSNIESIQRGLHSIGIEGTRINPKQETQISHFHEILHGYLSG